MRESFSKTVKTTKLKNKMYFLSNVKYNNDDHSIQSPADQMVQWLGKPSAVPEVLGSNPGQGMDVELSVLGCAHKLVDGRCQV